MTVQLHIRRETTVILDTENSECQRSWLATACAGKLIATSFSTKIELPKAQTNKKVWNVSICRVVYAKASMEICAESQEEAEAMALAAVCESEFKTSSVEYAIDGADEDAVMRQETAHQRT